MRVRWRVPHLSTASRCSTLLNSSPVMVQMAEGILAWTVAARGAEYINASSPKEWPAARVATFTGDAPGASMNTSQLHDRALVGGQPQSARLSRPPSRHSRDLIGKQKARAT